MEKIEHKTAVSNSLNNKNVCYIAMAELENLTILKDELASLRKKFFENNRTKQDVKVKNQDLGFNLSVKGHISHKNIDFKKVVDKVVVEQSFRQNNKFVILKKDINNNVCGKIFYDKDLRWFKTEYYSIADYTTASCMLKPNPRVNAVDVFTYNLEAKSYDVSTFFAVELGEDEKLIREVKRKFDIPIYAVLDSGLAVYCDRETQTEMLKLVGKDKNLDSNNDELIKEISQNSIQIVNQSDKKLPSLNQDIENIDIKNASEDFEYEEVEYLKIMENENMYHYTGRLIAGQKNGKGRLEKIDGTTIYDGEYLSDKKNGFGCLYTENGEIKYAGNWVKDAKDGRGILFSSNDKSMKVANFKNNKISNMVAEFDENGNLQCFGKNINGNPSGARVSYDHNNDYIIVEKNVNSSQKTKQVTIFNSDGKLLYSGGYLNGMKNGYGVEFDENMEVVFKGEFQEDEYLTGVMLKKI